MSPDFPNERKSHNYWDDLTPEQKAERREMDEREAEVRRNQAISEAQKIFDTKKILGYDIDNGEDSNSNNNNNNNGNGNGKDKDKKDKDKKEERKPQAERLVELITRNSNIFFKDQYGVAHVNLKVADHHEICMVKSDRFKRHLIREYYHAQNEEIPSQEAVASATYYLQAKAEMNETYELNVRVAWHKNIIYYDLTNDKWQFVKISNQGWQLENKTPVPMFVRYSQIPQVIPEKEYESEIFDKFINLTNLKYKADSLLLKVYIVSLLIPDIPHPVLQVQGEKGGAKSMLETFIKYLVDPAKPKLLSVHRDRMEFIQQIVHHYVAFYDNLDYVPPWLSDEVCRAVTGIGSSKRVLYSDDDDFVREYKRCLGFNGINLVLTNPDALDRSIVIEQDRIDDKNRKTEAEMLSKFNELKPRLLGCILDTLVEAIKIKPLVEKELKQLPRMADFALWGEAISRAMGYDKFMFIEAYYNNIGKQNAETLEYNTLGQAILIFLKKKFDSEYPSCWFGSINQFLEELNFIAIEHKLNTSSKGWPGAANSLSRKLKTILSNIREGLGYEITIVRSTTGKNKGHSVVRVEKISSLSSLSSLEENRAPNETENGKSSEDINKQ